jgi:hypothetical protein
VGLGEWFATSPKTVKLQQSKKNVLWALALRNVEYLSPKNTASSHYIALN